MDASLKMLLVQAAAGRACGNIQADAAADRARGNIKADELGACPQSSHLNVHQVLQVDGRRRPIEQVSGGPGALWVAVELLLGWSSMAYPEANSRCAGSPQAIPQPSRVHEHEGASCNGFHATQVRPFGLQSAFGDPVARPCQDSSGHVELESSACSSWSCEAEPSDKQYAARAATPAKKTSLSNVLCFIIMARMSDSMHHRRSHDKKNLKRPWW